jgi:ketosteroid isomerase-like protein
MSQENVEVVLAFHAAYNARELDVALAACAADVTVSPDASLFRESSSLVGRDEFRGLLEETWSGWTSGGVTPTEVLDIGDGRVLVRADWGGTGSASGVETHTQISQIYSIQDGQISRAEYFFDHKKALKAVGLEQ